MKAASLVVGLYRTLFVGPDRALLKREALVQEVIAASNLLAPMNGRNSSWTEWERALIALEKACRNLAEWKP